MNEKRKMLIFKLNFKKAIVNKMNILIFTLLILTNLLGFSFLLFLGTKDELNIKVINLELLMYPFLVNIFFISLLVIFLNNVVFYESFNNKISNLEIIIGFSKKQIWFQRFLVSKLIFFIVIFSQIILVNLLLLGYVDDYEKMLWGPKLFWWIYLFIYYLLFDAIYHLTIYFLKKEIFAVTLIFITFLFSSIILMQNSISKNSGFFGRESWNNISYRNMEMNFITYDLLNEKYESTSKLINDYINLKSERFINNNFIGISFQEIWTDEFLDSDSDSILLKIFNDYNEKFENNPNLFTWTYDTLENIQEDYDGAANYIQQVLEKLYSLENDKFYLDLKEIIDLYKYNDKYNFYQGKFKIQFKLPYKSELDKYHKLQSNPELVLIISLYDFLLNNLYNLNVNGIKKIYFSSEEMNNEFLKTYRFNYFNQAKIMFFGYNDEIYDYFMSWTYYGPFSNKMFKSLITDKQKITRYSNDLNFFLLENASNNDFNLNKDIFNEKSWYANKEILSILEDFSEKLVMAYFPLFPYSEQNWDLYFDFKNETQTQTATCDLSDLYDFSGQGNKCIRGGKDFNKFYLSNQNKSNFPTAFTIYDINNANNYLVSDKPTIAKDDYFIDVYSDKFFSKDETITIVNYYAVTLPRIFIFFLMDINAFWFFAYRYEKLW